MVLVVGAAGAYGSAVLRALVAAGVPARAFVRRPITIPGVDVVVGDAMHLADVLAAAEGCEAIVLAVNTRWHAWDPHLVKLVSTSVDAALEHSATLVFPTPVDAVKPIFDVPLPVPPPRLDINDLLVKKGEFRGVLEDQVRQSAELLDGRALLIRCNDFFGPGVTERPFGPSQTALLRGGPVPWYGPPHARRALTFIEDAASLTVAALRARRPPFLELAAPAHVFTPGEWVAAFGGRGVITPRKRWAVWLRGLIDREDREQVEMMYNWQGPLTFKDDPVKKLLPDWAPIPFDEAVARTRAWAGT